MRNVLVTGGAGAIGSRVVRQLSQSPDCDVTVLDDLSSGYKSNIFDITQTKLVEGSITDRSLVNELYQSNRFDATIHLAAMFANQNSVDHPLRDMEVNAGGTLTLLQEAARIHEGNPHTFVYTSSSCVYGNLSSGAIETQKPAPETPYAISKLSAENYVEFYRDYYGLLTTSFRLFNSYGPGERPGQYRNVIPNFIAKALRGETLTITGSGEETRDFTFVDDVAGALVKAALSNASGGIMNIATGRETSVIEMTKLILEYTESQSELKFIPRRKWDKTSRRVGNADRLQDVLDYAPSISIKDGLRQTVEWFRETPQIWQTK